MRKNCLGFLILYCAVFTWMAIPFVMAEDALLRDIEITPATKAEAILPAETVTAAADIEELKEPGMR